MNEQNKKIALNAGLFVGTIVVGSLLGWGAWLYNNSSPRAAPALVEAEAPRPAASPMVTPIAHTTVAVTPPVPVATAAPVPTPSVRAAAPAQAMQDYRNASPEQQQQMIQNYAQNLSRSEDPRVQQLATQMQTPEGQAQLREQAATLLQQFRRGGAEQGGPGFGTRTSAAPAADRFGGSNPANPPIPANVASAEDDSTDGG